MGKSDASIAKKMPQSFPKNNRKRISSYTRNQNKKLHEIIIVAMNKHWDKKHGTILMDLIKELDKNQVRYFILRNYED